MLYNSCILFSVTDIQQGSLFLLEACAETAETRARDERAAAMNLVTKLDLKHIAGELDSIPTVDILRVALSNLQQRANNNCAEMEIENTAHVELNTMSFPLGFTTGDATVDKGATLLRLLYIDDLRELQNEVNSIIVTMQEHTANPRTNASLGKVGR